jgi:DNA primase
VAAGLAQRGRQGGLYDRFRGRIMFPLADRRGQVLGFGARSMGEGRGPKYLNTSENDVYHKGRQLFGIDIARAHAARSGRIVVVEGYTDVLALHQAEIRDSVAIMGTALTAEQMAELGKAANAIVLALDADRSGQEAMLRAARTGGGASLRVVEMPEGKDPADLLAAGEADSFRALLDRALPMMQFQVRRVLADADLDTPAGRDRGLEEAARLIAEHTTEDSAMRDELVREAADRLDVPVEYIKSAAPRDRAPRPRPAAHSADAGAQPSAGELALRAEREFLVQCLAGGDLGRSYLSEPSDAHFSYEISRRARAHLVACIDDPLAGLQENEPELGAFVNSIVHEAAERTLSQEAVLRMSILQLEERRINREIRKAEHDRDHPRQSELAAARQRVRGELDAVMGQTA